MQRLVMPNLLAWSVLATRPELGGHLSLDPSRQHVLVLAEEGRHGRTVPFHDRPQRPRERFDYHVVVVPDHVSTDG